MPLSRQPSSSVTSLFEVFEGNGAGGGRRHGDALSGVEAGSAADGHDAVRVVFPEYLRAELDIFGKGGAALDWIQIQGDTSGLRLGWVELLLVVALSGIQAKLAGHVDNMKKLPKSKSTQPSFKQSPCR